MPIFQEVLSSCELVIFQLKDETVLLKGFHIITQKMPEKKKKNDFMWCPEQEQDFEQIKQEIVCSAEPRCSSRGTSLYRTICKKIYTAAGEKGSMWILKRRY